MPACRGQCLGLRAFRVDSKPSPRHVGHSIEWHCWFLQGEPALPRRACTQLGTGNGGRRLLGTVARLFPPRNQSAWSWPKPPERETHVHCRPQEGESCMQIGKIKSFHLAQLPWPDPCPLQALGESPASRSPSKALELSAETSQHLALAISPLSINPSAAWGVWVWEGLSAWGRSV